MGVIRSSVPSVDVKRARKVVSRNASADGQATIMGHKSREIADLLGYRGRDEMIHRDDLVLS